MQEEMKLNENNKITKKIQVQNNQSYNNPLNTLISSRSNDSTVINLLLSRRQDFNNRCLNNEFDMVLLNGSNKQTALGSNIPIKSTTITE